VLKWTYAYGYYAFEDEADEAVQRQREFFEFLQVRARGGGGAGGWRLAAAVAALGGSRAPRAVRSGLRRCRPAARTERAQPHLCACTPPPPPPPPPSRPRHSPPTPLATPRHTAHPPAHPPTRRQGDAESSLERLHDMCEKQIVALVERASGGAGGKRPKRPPPAAAKAGAEKAGADKGAGGAAATEQAAAAEKAAVRGGRCQLRAAAALPCGPDLPRPAHSPARPLTACPRPPPPHRPPAHRARWPRRTTSCARS
jgi:hypothetical protein